MTTMPSPDRIVPGSLLRAAFAAALLAAAGVLSSAAHAQSAGAEWSTPSGTPQGTRFSSLADITPANAGTLVEEFAFATGMRASHQGQPLVVGNTMYIVTPFPNKLIALDLANPGAVRWTFAPQVRQYARGVACCDVVNRGAVYAEGKIIYNLLDDTTVAVCNMPIYCKRSYQPECCEMLLEERFPAAAPSHAIRSVSLI